MPRTVPLTKAAMALLTQQLEDITINMLDKFGASDLVFPTLTRDGEITRIHYTGALRDMKKDQLIPKGLRAHNERHEFISSLVESSNLDESRIMSLMGHHSPASMQIYQSLRNPQRGNTIGTSASTLTEYTRLTGQPVHTKSHTR